MTDKPEVARTNEELADMLDNVRRGLSKATRRAAARRLRELDGERIEGCEVVHASWNNYGCLELLIRLPQGPVGHEVKVTDPATLILNPQEPESE